MFKKEIATIKNLLAQAQTSLHKFIKEESAVRTLWRRKNRVYVKAVTTLVDLTRHRTIKEAKLKEKIKTWPQINKTLTINRDDARKKIADKQADMEHLRIKLATLMAEEEAEQNRTNSIVEQVFSYNDQVTKALLVRNDFLSKNIYCLLVDDQGNMRSQITLDNSIGTHRVVAMVNTITIVKPELAIEAMDKIEQFFNRIKPQPQMDNLTKQLFEITKKLLVEKTSFKIGPDLYRFLSLKLDITLFPELVEAQDLLKKSLRSEKTNSYIRLYTRDNRNSKWEPVKQA